MTSLSLLSEQNNFLTLCIRRRLNRVSNPHTVPTTDANLAVSDPHIVHTTDANFAQDVLKSDKPVLLDFWAEWCGPCKMIAPVLDELATEYQGKVKIAKVNVDEHQGLAAQFRVTAIPTLLVIKNGQVSEQMVGAKSKRDLKATLDRATA